MTKRFTIRGLEMKGAYVLPKRLWRAPYQGLSLEARMLYGVMIDRLHLSLRNEWVNEKEEVYIILTHEAASEILGVKSRGTTTKAFKELLDAGLCDKDQVGVHKPNLYYPHDMADEEVVFPGDEPQPPAEPKNNSKPKPKREKEPTPPEDPQPAKPKRKSYQTIREMVLDEIAERTKLVEELAMKSAAETGRKLNSITHDDKPYDLNTLLIDEDDGSGSMVKNGVIFTLEWFDGCLLQRTVRPLIDVKEDLDMIALRENRTQQVEFAVKFLFSHGYQGAVRDKVVKEAVADRLKGRELTEAIKNAKELFGLDDDHAGMARHWAKRRVREADSEDRQAEKNRIAAQKRKETIERKKREAAEEQRRQELDEFHEQLQANNELCNSADSWINTRELKIKGHIDIDPITGEVFDVGGRTYTDPATGEVMAWDPMWDDPAGTADYDD